MRSATGPAERWDAPTVPITKTARWRGINFFKGFDDIRKGEKRAKGSLIHPSCGSDNVYLQNPNSEGKRNRFCIVPTAVGSTTYIWPKYDLFGLLINCD